jgi:hypothetical protein
MSYTIEELKGLCTKNPELIKFIDNAVTKFNKECIEINAYKNYGWKWDVEFDMYDRDLAMSKYCCTICNEDFIDDENDGWESPALNTDFLEYVGSNYWGKILLDNGDILLLIDEPLFSYFQVFSLDNLDDGRVDLSGFWEHIKFN